MHYCLDLIVTESGLFCESFTAYVWLALRSLDHGVGRLVLENGSKSVGGRGAAAAWAGLSGLMRLVIIDERPVLRGTGRERRE